MLAFFQVLFAFLKICESILCFLFLGYPPAFVFFLKNPRLALVPFTFSSQTSPCFLGAFHQASFSFLGCASHQTSICSFFQGHPRLALGLGHNAVILLDWKSTDVLKRVQCEEVCIMYPLVLNTKKDNDLMDMFFHTYIAVILTSKPHLFGINKPFVLCFYVISVCCIEEIC